MTIWTIVNPAVLISGLERSTSSTAAAQPVPLYDLTMALIAIAVWALVVAAIAAWLRARERNAARTHIRSMLIARRDGGASSAMRQRQKQTQSPPRHPWPTSAQQI
jgi:hypothetical protein